jgi:hypothetical protein
MNPIPLLTTAKNELIHYDTEFFRNLFTFNLS